MRILKILSGQSKGEVFNLTVDQVTIGREEDNAVILSDDTVSRHHAVLLRTGNEYKLRDCGSRNGTRVKGQAAGDTLLEPNGTFEIGSVQIGYEAAPEAARSTDEVTRLRSELAQATAQAAQTAELTRRNQNLAADLAAATQQLAAARTANESQLAEAKNRLATSQVAEQQLTTLAREKQELSAHLVATHQQVAEVQQRAATELSAVRAELAQSKTATPQLQALAAQTADLTAKFAAAQHEAAAALDRANAATARTSQAEADLLQTRAEVTRLTQAMEASAATQIQIRQELAQAREELARARAAVGPAPANGAIESLRAELVKVQAELAQVQGKAELAKAYESRLIEIATENRKLAAQLPALEQQLQEAQARLGLRDAGLLRQALVRPPPGPPPARTILPGARPMPMPGSPVTTPFAVGAPAARGPRAADSMLPMPVVVAAPSRPSHPPPSRAVQPARRPAKRVKLLPYVAGGLIFLAAGVLGLSLLFNRPAATPGTASRPTGGLDLKPGTEGRPPSSALTTPAAQQFVDAKGRFKCDKIAGWQIKQDPNNPRSVVEFVSGRNTIRVVSHGSNWPRLERADVTGAEQDFERGMERAKKFGLTGSILGSTWRVIDEEPAVQFDTEYNVKGERQWVRMIEYRKHGHDHTIILTVVSLPDKEYYTLVLENFLGRFHSLPTPPEEPATAAAAK